MSDVDDFLAHYGKKGMKWGVRNDDNATAPKTKESRKDYRKRIKAEEADFNTKKIDAVFNRALERGDDILVSTMYAGDYAVTIESGKSFVRNTTNGAAFNAHYTDVFAERKSSSEDYDYVPMYGSYKPTARRR